jgi:hypothetical protein
MGTRTPGATVDNATLVTHLHSRAMTADASEGLLRALEELERLAQSLTADEAARTLEEATLQVFWQRWPQASSWAGALWRQLNADLADAATPHDRSEFHDVGGEGGG